MKKRSLAIIMTALLLCSCASGGEMTEAPQSEISSEMPESTGSAVSVTTKAITSAENTAAESAEAIKESISETVSEIITETEYSELLSTESIAETELSSETSVITALSSVSKEAAPAVVPKIKTGNFSGEKMLENDLAAVDISSASDGVIRVTYKGKCPKVKVRITKDEAIYDYSLDPGGTVFPLQSGSGTYNVKVLENVSGKTYAIVLDNDFEAAPDELSPYLVPMRYMNLSQDHKFL